MAIRKNAKNINVKVKNDYKVMVGGKLEKIANIINVESTKDNMVLVSNKKIISLGNK